MFVIKLYKNQYIIDTISWMLFCHICYPSTWTSKHSSLLHMNSSCGYSRNFHWTKIFVVDQRECCSADLFAHMGNLCKWVNIPCKWKMELWWNMGCDSPPLCCLYFSLLKCNTMNFHAADSNKNTKCSV